MQLFRLTGVGNLCFNSLSPFLSIVCILSSQVISFEILFYALFPRFPWSPLLPFPSYFKLHNRVFGNLCHHTWHGLTTADDIELSHPRSSQQHPPYPDQHQSASYQPVSPHTSWLYDAPPHATSPHPQQ